MSPPPLPGPSSSKRGHYHNANCSVVKLLRHMSDPVEMRRKRQRAYEEEAEKKRQKEEERKKMEEDRWFALGMAVCHLSLDDFILSPPTISISPSTPSNPLLEALTALQSSQKAQLVPGRGKDYLRAVFTFCSNLKALLGPNGAKNIVFSDVHNFTSILTGVSKSNIIRLKRIYFQ